MLAGRGLVVTAALALLLGCSEVVETGPDARVGKGFQEVVVTVTTTSAPGQSTGTTSATGTTTATGTSTTVPSTTAATGTTAPAPSGTSTTGVGLVFSVGDCLTWDQAATTTVRFVVVDCSASHLVEIAGKGDLSDAFGPAAAYPDLSGLQAAVNTVCSPLVDTYLAGASMDGIEPGVIPPSEAAWAAGDRTAWCTVGLTRVDGERQPYTGRLADR